MRIPFLQIWGQRFFRRLLRHHPAPLALSLCQLLLNLFESCIVTLQVEWRSRGALREL